jgi:hypothetical protein
MSVTTVVQALGWIPVVWLLATHLLHDRGRLPDHATALRIAGFAAAATVVAGAVATSMWPLAALGVLWLRSEVFAHRHRREHVPVEAGDADEEPRIHWHASASPEGEVEGETPEPEGESHPEPEVLDDVRIHHGPAAVVRGQGVQQLPVQARAETGSRGAPVRRSVPPRPRPRSERDHLPAAVALRTRPPAAAEKAKKQQGPEGFVARMSRVAGPALSILFKIEIVIAVVIVLVLFGIWSQEQRGDFGNRTNGTLCKLMNGC